MVRKLTAALMVVSIALTVWVAWMAQPRYQPSPGSPRRVRRAYAATMLSATGGIVLCLVAAGVGATIVSRQAKREYREQAMRNLRSLVEGEPLSPPGERGRGEGSGT